MPGQMLAEPTDPFRDRAELVRRALVLRDIAPDTIAIVAPLPRALVAEAFDGIATAGPRRVDVTIRPGGVK